jgi:hypothetical protein
MKKVLVAGAIAVACSTGHAQAAHLNQNSLALLKKMCNSVLIQLDAQDMMYVKEFNMSEYMNRESGAVVGLDVVSINPKESTNIHTCHYDFTTVKADGTPDVAKMLVDMVPVNITLAVSPDTTPASGASTSMFPSK